MPTTTKWGLRYPALSDTPDVPRDIQNLANDLDDVAKFSSGALASRPAQPKSAGYYYYATDAGLLYLSDGANWITISVADGAITSTKLATPVQESLFQAGDLKSTARASAPTGWLICDGAPVNRNTYAALFAAIATTYGVGDNVNTFNLPDLRGRVPVGVDGAAARLDALDALGAGGGAQKHTLASTESGVAAHGHTSGTLSTDPAGAHGHNASGGNGFVTISQGGVVFLKDIYHYGSASAGNGNVIGVTSGSVLADGGTNSSGTHTHPVQGAVANHAGAVAAQAHNNMQPYQVVNWIIKT